MTYPNTCRATARTNWKPTSLGKRAEPAQLYKTCQHLRAKKRSRFKEPGVVWTRHHQGNRAEPWKLLTNRKHGWPQRKGRCCKLTSLTERSWCGAKGIMGLGCNKICATRADEPELNWVFYCWEAHAAPLLPLHYLIGQGGAGCAGQLEECSIGEAHVKRPHWHSEFNCDQKSKGWHWFQLPCA